MSLLITIAELTGIIWIVTIVLMLPVYFFRKKKNPDDERNTWKSLLVKSFLASAVCALVFGSGLLAMYFDEIRGIYRR